MNKTFPKVVDWIARARADSVESFKRLIGGPVLVGQPPTSEGDSAWTFRTDSRRVVMDRTCSLLLNDSDSVLVLRKTPGTPFADTILLGRAATNDVCLQHSSVSKLHARIRFNANWDMWVTDAESRNGTTVGARRLGPGETIQLKEGMFVAFGHCRFQFLSAERFWELLRKFPG